MRLFRPVRTRRQHSVANAFRSFFINKISAIHSSFPADSHSRALIPPDSHSRALIPPDSHSRALIPPDSHSRALILLDTMKFLQSLTCVAAYVICRLVRLAPGKS